MPTETPATPTPAPEVIAPPPIDAPPIEAPPTEPVKLTALERAKAAFERVSAENEAKRATKRAAPATVEPKPHDAKTDVKPSVTETPPAPKEQESTGWAKIARLERQARESIKAAKVREDNANAQLAEMKAKMEAYEAAKADPIKWLESGGHNYEKATAQMLNGGKQTPEQLVELTRAELADYKKQQAEAQASAARSEQERINAQINAQRSEWRAGIVDFVKTNAAKYELTHQQGRHELVADVISQHYEDTKKLGEPRVMGADKAAELVEEYLEAQADKLLQTAKLAARYKLVTAEPTPAAPAQPRTAPTLSNAVGASSASAQKSTRRTWEQRRADARLAMENARK
jgi:hypothetical protein